MVASSKITVLREGICKTDSWVSPSFPKEAFYLNKLWEHSFFPHCCKPQLCLQQHLVLFDTQGFQMRHTLIAYPQHRVVRALHLNCSKQSGTCLYLIMWGMLSCSILYHLTLTWQEQKPHKDTRHWSSLLTNTTRLVEFAYFKNSGFPFWCLMYTTQIPHFGKHG